MSTHTTEADTSTITLTITERQQNILLGALAEKAVDLDRYLSSYRDVDKPDALDICCDAHLARFNERQSQRDMLKAQQNATRELSRLVENSSFTAAARTALERIELVYRDTEGTEYTQPLSDITEAGTLIDPESGDDLELISAKVTAEPDGWNNSVPRELAGVLEDREEDESIAAAQWLAENEDSDEVWSMIGRLLDDITEAAK